MKIQSCISLSIACGALLLSGCRSKDIAYGFNSSRVDETRAAIEETIEDSARKSAVLKLVNDYEQQMQAFDAEAMDVRKRIISANAAYDTTREELEALYAELHGITERFGALIKQKSLEIREICTEEEWKALTEHKTKPIHFQL